MNEREQQHALVSIESIGTNDRGFADLGFVAWCQCGVGRWCATEDFARAAWETHVDYRAEQARAGDQP